MILTKYFYQIKRKLHNKHQLRKVHQNGDNQVFGNIDIVNPNNLSIGSGCSFNHGAYINAFNPIEIGDDVTLSAGAKIISTGIDYAGWSEGKKAHLSNSGIVIGNHVWIGSSAQILAGVKITGEYVAVAAGAVLTQSITENRCIVAGCPAKIIKMF